MYRKYIKRIFDIIFSLIALIVLSPCMIVLAILVRINLGSPVIFRQRRPGKDEKIFTIYKFRTMTDERDENGGLLPDEARLTKFGEFLRSSSLDELPELINIIKGDMSIVGPRPLLAKYLPHYNKLQKRRHEVRPGLTGLAQINGRNSAAWEDRFIYDAQYIDGICFLQDIKIIFATIRVVLKREGIKGGFMDDINLKNKKLLILGGNPETVPLVETANGMGVRTIVSSARRDDAAKKAAWKSYDVDGLDIPGLAALAREEKVDGVMVGVADILVPSYYKVCDELGLPCYATQKIIDVFTLKDRFKETCERYGIHGIPEYYLDKDMNPGDIAKIKYPVMVKPVDNGGGVGMTVCYDAKDLQPAVDKALAASNRKRFIVEKYMQCDDMGMYYTFKDGFCSASCIYDRYTTGEQPGLSRVCLGGVYPSKHIEEYFGKMHGNACRLFKDIGIRNGVLMLSGFYENGEFYVYDTGFRLQGEAPHLLMKAIHGFDQREMLIKFALTGSEGDIDLAVRDDPYLRGKRAATLWFLLKKGKIAKIEGLSDIINDPKVVANIQRLYEGDTVREEFIGTEKQVLARLYIVCENKLELAKTLKYYMAAVKVYDENGGEMLLHGFDVDKVLEL